MCVQMSYISVGYWERQIYVFTKCISGMFDKGVRPDNP